VARSVLMYMLSRIGGYVHCKSYVGYHYIIPSLVQKNHLSAIILYCFVFVKCFVLFIYKNAM
jgi:hypothetical protein